ncbi:MAG: hypothetical protein AAFP86_20310 [Planctomycetota bacterium]
MTFEIRFDASRALRELRQTPTALARRLRPALEEHADWVNRTKWQRETFGLNIPPWQRNPTSNRLRSRTGALRRSWRQRSRGTGLDLRLIVSIGNARTAAYARIQEEGGTIRPKRSRYLTIPLRANYTPAGRLRVESAAAARRDPSIQTFVRRSKRGNLIIFRKGRQRSKPDAIEPIFVLKQQVKVPARLGFRALFGRPDVVRDREQRIGAVVRQTLGGGS